MFESSGPEGKIRGTAQQVLERYLALARDASSGGDTVAAESLFQHAEHYYRVIHSVDAQRGERPQRAPAEGPPETSSETLEAAASPAVTKEAESASY